MTFQLPEYPILRRSPIGNAIDSYNDIKNNALARQLQQMNLQKLQAEQPTWKDAAQAELLQKQLQPDLLRAQTSNINSEAGLNNLKLKYPGLGEGGIVGQIAYAKMLKSDPDLAKQLYMGSQAQQPQQQGQVPGQPQQGQIPGQNALGQPQQQQQQANNDFNPLQLLLKSINSDITSKQSLSDWRNSGGFGRGSGVAVQTLNAISNQVQRENPNFTPDQVNEATSAYLEGTPTLSNGMPLKPPSGQINALLNANYKLQTDVAQRNQERYANTLKTTFDYADQVAPNAFKFAGAAGKIKGGIDALRAQRGDNDPEYKDYLIFTRQVIPALATEILRTGGANSTDTQKALAIQQVNPIKYDNNTSLAMDQFKFLEGLYKDISKTVTKSAFQNRNELNSNRPSQGSSVQDSKVLGGQTYHKVNGTWLPVIG